MHHKGFTTIELLVIVAISGLLFAISFPAFRNFSSQLYLGAAAKNLAASLRAAQIQAISQHKTLTFTPAKSMLPSGIKLKKNKAIVFSSSGTTPPGGSGTIILSNISGRYKKIIISTSGRVRIE